MAAGKPAEAEKYLQQQLRRQIAALHQRQYPIDWSSKEIGALKSAVRAELWRLAYPSLTPPGAA